MLEQKDIENLSGNGYAALTWLVFILFQEIFEFLQIYRRSFLINDDDIEKWKNYQAYNVNILQEQPPDVPLRTTSLFCDKEEDKNRSPSVFVPVSSHSFILFNKRFQINGPLLLQPSKSFEKKAKKAVKRRNSLSSDFLTKVVIYYHFS